MEIEVTAYDEERKAVTYQTSLGGIWADYNSDCAFT